MSRCDIPLPLRRRARSRPIPSGVSAEDQLQESFSTRRSLSRDAIVPPPSSTVRTVIGASPAAFASDVSGRDARRSEG